MPTENLRKAFSLDNLFRAWTWTLTNPDRQYKSYFRHIYRGYSLAFETNIRDLHQRLINGTYNAIHATKIYLPKKSGILRPYTLLGIEDQILYQALANVIAEKLHRKIKDNYLITVFGHLYASKQSLFFYKRWKDGYKKYSNAFESAYRLGYKYVASFDLTACYDSIDHSVLGHFLRDIGLEQEFIDYLCLKLRYWSANSQERPIYQGHGIPQGPQPSGIISECVLRYFDQNMKKKGNIKYLRYVDDIRILAMTESDLRKELINLDMHSKNIGLFPQSSKIDIHKIIDVKAEIKNISNPPEIVLKREEPDQKKVLARLVELTPRYTVTDETRFKYVLGGAKPSARLHLRLLKILKRQPHLYQSIFNNLSKTDKLTRQVSAECFKILKEYTLYAAFTSSLINTLHGRIYKTYKAKLTNFCQKHYTKSQNPQIKVAVSQVLIDSSKLSYNQKCILIGFKNWWTRSNIAICLREDLIGKPSYETLINKLLKDEIPDVAILAADRCIEHNLSLHKPKNEIQRIAQISLKKAGLLGRITAKDNYCNKAIKEVLGSKTRVIDWNIIFGKRHKEFLSKIVRWSGYSKTDATAWVNITDTINDSLLDILFVHDGTIGQYQHGNIGGALSSQSKFANKYPKLHKACMEIHGKRLESDLSHSKVKSSGKLTKYIKHKEIKPLCNILVEGYVELWKNW